MPSRRVSWAAIRPRNSAVTRSTAPSPSPWARRPSFSQSGTNGARASISSGRTAAMLTALVTTPPVSAAVTCSAVTTPALSWASAVEAPRCGVTTTSSRAKIACSVKGSEGKTSSAAPASLPTLEPRLDRVEVDELAAGAVDYPGAVLHRGDRVGVDQADRLRGLRRVQGDDVGAAEQVLEALGPLDPELAEALGRDELVEGDDLHVEALGALGDELADAAEADHPEGLAVELGALELGPLPGAAGERAVRLGDVAAEGEHQGQGVLGGGDRVRFGRVGDDHAAAGGSRDVDVVDAGSGPADHLEPLAALDQLGGHLGRRADQDRVVGGDRSPSSSSDISRPRSTSKFSRSRSTPESAIFSLTRTFTGPSGGASSGHPLGVLDHPVDAGGERLDVGGLDRREHPDPQLVAAQLAIGLGVDDPVLAQDRGEGGGVDRVVEVDRADDQRAPRRVGDEGRREAGGLRPASRGARRRRRCAPRTSRGRRRPASTRSGRRAGSASPPRACCRSGPCASSRPRSAARGRPAASGRRRRRARSIRSIAAGLRAASQSPPSEPKAFCGAK